MANTFVTLAVPAGDGVGAAVDVSTLSPLKTVSVDGGSFSGTLIVETSTDGGVTFGPEDLIPFVDAGRAPQDVTTVAQYMRVRRFNSSSGPLGSPTVRIGGATISGNVYGSLAVPIVGGTGASLDLSLGGATNTFQVIGDFKGRLVIQISEDNTTFSGSLVFDSGGGVPQTFIGTVRSARVLLVSQASGGVPIVSAGSSSSGSGGGFPGFGSVQRDWVQPRDGVSALVPRADHQHAVFPQAQSFVVYAVDYDGTGNDVTAIPGYAPSTGVPATDMATALAAALLTPFKTLERVGQLLPRDGNNANCVVLVKPRVGGATYRNIANTTDQDGEWMSNSANWRNGILTRGTLDFSNSATDKIVVGMQTQALGFAANAGGYNVTAGTAANFTTIQLNGGGAPGFPAEAGGSSAITGKRVRFDAATVTVALRNATTMVHQNAAASIVPAQDLPAAPAAGDIFYLEEPAVRVGSLSMTAPSGPGFATKFALKVAGYRDVGASTTFEGLGGLQIAASELAGPLAGNGVLNFIAIRFYRDEQGAQISVGVGIRGSGAANTISYSSATTCRNCMFGGLFSAAAGFVLMNGGNVLVGGFRQNDNAIVTMGPNGLAGARRNRITSPAVAAIRMQGGAIAIAGLDVSGVVVPVILCDNTTAGNQGGGITVSIEDLVTPGGAATDVLLDTTLAIGATVRVASGISATSTLGNVRAAAGSGTARVANAFATVNAFEGFFDTSRNLLKGAAPVYTSGSVCDFVNDEPGTVPEFRVVRKLTGGGTSFECTQAQADSTANADGLCGVTTGSTLTGARGLMVTSGYKMVDHVAGPGNGQMSWLSATNAGFATNVRPVSPNLAIPLGWCIAVNGGLGLLSLIPSSYAQTLGTVTSVAAGTCISVTGTAAVPIVNNTGVCTVTAGTGITITGTATNPIINATTATVYTNYPFSIYCNTLGMDADVHFLGNNGGVSQPAAIPDEGPNYPLYRGSNIQECHFQIDECTLAGGATLVTCRIRNEDDGTSQVIFTIGAGAAPVQAGAQTNLAFGLSERMAVSVNPNGGTATLRMSGSVEVWPI